LLQLALFLISPSSQAGSATWQLNPMSSDWNTAANWMPNTVPNGLSDIATFDVSNTTDVAISADTTVDSVVFNPGASAFSISVPPEGSLAFGVGGIANNSGITQNFVAEADESGSFGTISFVNGAAAGAQTTFTTQGSTASSVGGEIKFFGSSSAGNGIFINEGAPPNTSFAAGRTIFLGTSTAANGAFINKSGAGMTQFLQSSSAGNGTFTNAGGASGAGGGMMTLEDNSSAGNGTFTTNGSSVSQFIQAEIKFSDFSTADHGTFTVNGGTAAGASGGFMTFLDKSTAADGMFIINGAAVSGAEEVTWTAMMALLRQLYWRRQIFPIKSLG
jgi:hypothetical protein